MERRDRLGSPRLALSSLRLRPDDRLPVGGEDEPRTGVADLEAIATRLVHVQEERLLDGVLVRPRLDLHAVVEADVRRAEDLLATVHRIRQMMQPAARPRVVLRDGEVVALVVDGEPRRLLAAV